MSNITPSGSGGIPLEVDITGSGIQNPQILNVALPTADTEVEYVLPANCKQFYIKLRDPSAQMKLSYTSGQSGTTYLTVSRGNWYSEDGINATTTTLYIQSSTSGQVAEIVAWT